MTTTTVEEVRDFISNLKPETPFRVELVDGESFLMGDDEVGVTLYWSQDIAVG